MIVVVVADDLPNVVDHVGLLKAFVDVTFVVDVVVVVADVVVVVDEECIFGLFLD